MQAFTSSLKVKTFGKWIGVAKTVGPVMTFWILPILCVPIPISTIILIQPHEFNDSVKKLLLEYTATVNNKIGDNTKYIVPANSLQQSTLLDSDLPISDKWDGDESILPYEPSSEENAMEQLDEFIGTQIPIGTKYGPALVKVISRKQFSDDTLVVTKHDEPKLDYRLYNVKFLDGQFEQYFANVLHESLSSRLDDQVYDTRHINEICDYRFDSKMIPKDKAFIISLNGNRAPIVTIKSCDIRVRLNDDQTAWVPLNIMKNCEPLLLAESASRMNITNESIFHWWVPHVLAKKTRLLNKVQAVYHKNDLKFGIKVP